ncbi:MAG: TerD family protein [Pseudomonadota bacterium]
MNIFLRGQKGKLADLGCSSTLRVEIVIDAPGIAIDVSCFGVDAAGQLSDERYMVFYNQLSSPESALRLELAPGKALFDVRLDALPASIDKLVFTAAIDGDASMRAIGASTMTLSNAVQFPLSGADFQDEKAVILGEIYRKDGQWRFGAVGQGFNGGLAALLKHFGGTAAAPAPAPAAPVPVAASAPSKVSLSKVTLEKRGDKVSLDKRGGQQGFGPIHVNLSWNQAPAVAAKTGFLAKLTGAGGAPRGIDLDIGCMYEMADGTPGLVQALGNTWGNFEQWPYIHLDADDRTGEAKGGENLRINGAHFDKIKRALIFTFIYQGAADWAATGGVVTIEMPQQAPIEVRLDQGERQIMCAIAMIENRAGSMQITKLVEYFSQQGQQSAHELMDRKFGFGLRWAAGRKD